jgi:Flp pilus assembly CpaE family ATPase
MQEDTMSDVESLRNALGTLQILYNFPQASPKPHAVFNYFKIDRDR